MTLIEVRKLSLRLPQREDFLFENLSFQVQPGEKIALTGASGTGKTLFLRSICRLEPYATGEVLLEGRLPHSIPEFRAKVLYLGQRGSFSPGTVESAFREAFSFRVHRKKSWNMKQTQEDLAFFGKPHDFLSQKIQNLSGGEKQILQILRAVALQPQILCLDEPTSALDFTSVEKMETWLKSHFSGAWIWVTHQTDQARRVSNRCISLSDLGG